MTFVAALICPRVQLILKLRKPSFKWKEISPHSYKPHLDFTAVLPSKAGLEKIGKKSGKS